MTVPLGTSRFSAVEARGVREPRGREDVGMSRPIAAGIETRPRIRREMRGRAFLVVCMSFDSLCGSLRAWKSS